MDRTRLRPLERAVLQLTDRGMTSAEIAWRFRRSPGHIDRVLELSRFPRSGTARADGEPGALRPVERTVMRGRSDGAPHAEIAARLRRTPAYVARVEAMANHKLRAAAGA
jgi:DNA-binding CsgD family transcriptional regulator